MSRRRTYSAVSGVDITPKYLICNGFGTYTPSGASYTKSKYILGIYEIGVDYPIAIFDASDLYYQTTTTYFYWSITRNYETDLLYINSVGSSTYSKNRFTYTYNPSTNTFSKLFSVTPSSTDSTYRVIGISCTGDLIKFSNYYSKLMIGSSYVDLSSYCSTVNRLEVFGDDIVINGNILIGSDLEVTYTELYPSSMGSSDYITDNSGDTITLYNNMTLSPDGLKFSKII